MGVEQASRVMRSREGDRHSYDRFASHSAIRAVDAALVNLVPQGSGLVIDNACGTGAVTQHLLEQGKLLLPYMVIGVDPDPDARTEARRKFATHHNIHFVGGVSERLPISNSTARVVVQANGIHLTDAQQSFAESFRVLKPGGGNFVSTGYENTLAHPGPESIFWGYLLHYAKINLKELGYEGSVGKSIDLLKTSKEQYVKMAYQEGFERVKVRQYVVPMDADAMEAICDYGLFVQGALPGVPVDIGAQALIRAIPQAFERLNKGRDGTEGKEKITYIRRGWMFLEAWKPD